MPDADRVHAGLPRKYQKVYQQVWEGYMPAEELAHNILTPLKKDIQDYGDGPPNLIKRVSESLEEKTSLPILRLTIDYNAESQNIEDLAQKTPGNPRGIALAQKTCEEYLQSIQQGEADQVCTQQMMQQYVESVYDHNFVQRIPLVEQHHDNADLATIDRTLEDMKPHINHFTANMAEQLVKKDNVESLRVPKRTWTDSPVDIHNDDLLSMEV